MPNHRQRDLLLNVLLDLGGLQGSPYASSLNDLGNQCCMLHGLAALHDPHNGSLRFEVSVGSSTLVRRLLLLLGLLELDLIDLDALLDVGEPSVEGKGVCSVDILALGVFG